MLPRIGNRQHVEHGKTLHMRGMVERQSIGDAAAPIRLMGVAMPPTGPSHDYVLWATGLPGNAPVAIAVMDPADGVTRPVNATTGPATPDERTPRGWAMSVEPSGPVPARPSTVVAAGIAT